MPEPGLGIRAIDGLPEVAGGADLGLLIAEATGGAGMDGAILVVSHKVVSKAEGSVVRLDSVEPGERAMAIASEQGRDPRHVEVILGQSAELLRAEHGVLICVTRHGFTCANAGVDASNAADAGELVLLPADPDASARRLRARLAELTGTKPAVVIADSFGRAWRLGQVDVAIGCAGLLPIDDWAGRADRSGRRLSATAIAIADAAAAAADLARGKDSGQPVVLISGLDRFVTDADGPGAASLLRPPEQDLFRD